MGKTDDQLSLLCKLFHAPSGQTFRTEEFLLPLLRKEPQKSTPSPMPSVSRRNFSATSRPRGYQTMQEHAVELKERQGEIDLSCKLRLEMHLMHSVLPLIKKQLNIRISCQRTKQVSSCGVESYKAKRSQTSTILHYGLAILTALLALLPFL